MKKLLCLFVVLLPLTGFSREGSEWVSIFWYNATSDKLPRILLIGDSICKGYQGVVRKELAGTAYSSYYATSKCVTDRSFLKELRYVLDEYDYAVVNFNNGLHSLGKNPAKWEEGLRKAIDLIKEKGTKIIWTSSTPLKDPKRTEEVKVLNEIALRVMKEKGVPINDLYALMDPHDRNTMWVDTYHFTGEGRKLQGKQIAKAIRETLGKAKASKLASKKMLKEAESETGPDGKLVLNKNASNVVRNGGFEQAGQWAIYPRKKEAGSFKFVSTKAYSGKRSVEINANKGVQFYQSKLALVGGHKYDVTFLVMAEKPDKLTFYIRSAKPPYKYYGKQVVDLTTQWQEFNIEMTLPEDYKAATHNLFFIVKPGKYWLDDVTISTAK